MNLRRKGGRGEGVLWGGRRGGRKWMEGGREGRKNSKCREKINVVMVTNSVLEEVWVKILLKSP